MKEQLECVMRKWRERLSQAIQRAKVKTVFDEKGKSHAYSAKLLEEAMENRKYLYTNLNALGSSQNKAAYEAYVDGIDIENTPSVPAPVAPAPETTAITEEIAVPEILKDKTKKELVKFAADELGVKLSERLTRDELIGEIISFMG